jgi:hypothetical protein
VFSLLLDGRSFRSGTTDPYPRMTEHGGEM